LGCNHTQTDASLTLNDGILGIKPIGPKVSTEKSSKTKIPRDFDSKDGGRLTKDSQITTNEEDSKTPPPCPLQGPIPPNCTMKPPIKENSK